MIHISSCHLLLCPTGPLFIGRLAVRHISRRCNFHSLRFCDGHVFAGLFGPLRSQKHIQGLSICTSAVLGSSKIQQLGSSGLSRRKRTDPVVLKKQKSKKQTVHIFDGMSLRHLAVAVDMDFDSFYLEVLCNVVSEEEAEMHLNSPDRPIDRHLVIDIISFLGLKPLVVSPPKEWTQTEVKDVFPQPLPPANELVPRSPVVTIMGHVDHGKTTLLDALRKSNIVAQEFGGITQHIGAFSVKLPDVSDNRTVTFLDTPGHSAFRAMRERGARATDVVVLVVAADDSVMEQTVESIRYAREADVPIVVAINKCDKPGVDPIRVQHDLLHHEIVTEHFGGETLAVEISALYGRGLEKLQEAILLQADFLELKSTPKGPVEGTIIESSNAKGLGYVCTLIVNRGTLRKGAFLVSGNCWCRVKAMSNEFGAQVDSAGPSTPVRMAGWREQLPPPGELALEVDSQQKAQSVIAYRRECSQEMAVLKEMDSIEAKRANVRRHYMEARKEKMAKGVGQMHTPVSFKVESQLRKENEQLRNAAPKFKMLLKCDVEGTLEAIKSVFDTYSAQDQVCFELVNVSVGQLNERDLELAAEFKAHIFCFNSPVPQRILLMAQALGVELEQFNIIYKLVDRLKELLTERIPVVLERRLMGEGTVIAEYRIMDGQKKKQPVAGIRLDWGRMEKDNAIWHFSRPKVTISKKPEATPSESEGTEDTADTSEQTLVTFYEGPIQMMQHEKQTITTASGDMNIGVSLEDKNIRFKEYDKVEVYEDVQVPQQLKWAPPGF